MSECVIQKALMRYKPQWQQCKTHSGLSEEIPGVISVLIGREAFHECVRVKQRWDI